jgi:hypothetical protein
MELMGHKRKGPTSLDTHLFKDAYDGVEDALAAALCVPSASPDAPVATGSEEDASTADPLYDGAYAEGAPTDVS